MRRRRAAIKGILFVSFIAAVSASARAQSGAAALTGIVRGPDKAPAAGAAVSVTSVGTLTSRAVVTGADGVYTASPLASGTYKITVTKSGFPTLVRDDVRPAHGRNRAARFSI